MSTSVLNSSSAGDRDPGDQRGGGLVGGAAGGFQGAGQEGRDLLRSGGIAVEELAPLGHQGGAEGTAGRSELAPERMFVSIMGRVVTSIAIMMLDDS